MSSNANPESSGNDYPPSPLFTQEVPVDYLSSEDDESVIFYSGETLSLPTCNCESPRSEESFYMATSLRINTRDNASRVNNLSLTISTPDPSQALLDPDDSLPEVAGIVVTNTRKIFEKDKEILFIQKYARGFLIRKQSETLKRNKASLFIQKYARSFITRKRLERKAGEKRDRDLRTTYELDEAAILIEKHVRRFLIRTLLERRAAEKRERNLRINCERNEAAIFIQKHMKGFLTRNLKTTRERNKASLLIQKRVRGLITRKRSERQVEKKRERNLRMMRRREKSALMIQKHVRGLHTRKWSERQAAKMRERNLRIIFEKYKAAILIQRYVRGLHTRKWSERQGGEKRERAQRMIWERNRAITLIQKHVRSLLTRKWSEKQAAKKREDNLKMMRERNKASTLIQRYVRGLLTRSFALNGVIQRAVAPVQTKDKNKPCQDNFLRPKKRRAKENAVIELKNYNAQIESNLNLTKQVFDNFEVKLRDQDSYISKLKKECKLQAKIIEGNSREKMYVLQIQQLESRVQMLEKIIAENPMRNANDVPATGPSSASTPTPPSRFKSNPEPAAQKRNLRKNITPGTLRKPELELLSDMEKIPDRIKTNNLCGRKRDFDDVHVEAGTEVGRKSPPKKLKVMQCSKADFHDDVSQLHSQNTLYGAKALLTMHTELESDSDTEPQLPRKSKRVLGLEPSHDALPMDSDTNDGLKSPTKKLKNVRGLKLTFGDDTPKSNSRNTLDGAKVPLAVPKEIVEDDDVLISQLKTPSIRQKKKVRVVSDFKGSGVDGREYVEKSNTTRTLKFPDIVSPEGIRFLKEKREVRRTKKTGSKTMSNGTAMKRLQKKSCKEELPSSPRKSLECFHLTQSQSSDTSINEVSREESEQESESESSLPFVGLSFIVSGVDKSINKVISKLGGYVLEEFTDQNLTESKVKGKAFFISQPTARRKIKYVMASALGVPMLHYNWVKEIELSHKSEDRKFVFDSSLFEKWRLPVGLSLKTGLFSLQRARYARKWQGPGSETKTPIFAGMKFVVALNDMDLTETWGQILRFLGATKGTTRRREIDSLSAVLVDGMLLPPHTIAVPSQVATILSKARDRNIPIVELSWVVQSIVERKCLRFNSEPRYIVDENNSEPFSIKVRVRREDARFEVGDTVEFARGRGKKNLSYGRIMKFHRARTNSSARSKLNVKLLIPNGIDELVENDSHVHIEIFHTQLKRHIILLSRNDFKKTGLGETGASHIFAQKKNSTSV